jgi:hypothetical protein
MVMIRPLLRANRHLHHRARTVVFFVFLVANIGGGITPLGHPPSPLHDLPVGLMRVRPSPLLTFLGYFWGPYPDLTTRALIMLLHAGDRER